MASEPLSTAALCSELRLPGLGAPAARMEQQRPRAAFSLDASKVGRGSAVSRVVVGAAVSADATTTAHERAAKDAREYVLAVADGGAIESTVEQPRKLVIPVPALSEPTAPRERDHVQRPHRDSGELSSTHEVADVSADSSVAKKAPSRAHTEPAPEREALLASLFRHTEGSGLARKRPRTQDSAGAPTQPLLARTRDATAGEDVLPDTYSRVPVDEFGAAMLRGMGVAEDEIQGDTAAANDSDAAGRPRLPKAVRHFGVGVRETSAEAVALMYMDDPTHARANTGKGYIPKPGAAPLTQLKELAAPSAPGAAGESKGSRADRIRMRKYPGMEVGAAVRVTAASVLISGAAVSVPDTGVVGVLTQVDGVPGLESCRVLIPRSMRTEPAVATDTDTVLCIVPKVNTQTLLTASGEVFQGADVSQPVLEALRSLQQAHSRLVAAAEAAARQAQTAAASTNSSAPSMPSTAPAVSGSAAAPAVPNGADAATAASTWLRPKIRARVVDRHALGERYYLAKCVIRSVDAARARCTIELQRDDGSIKTVSDVRERELETALPKPGGVVMVLRGELAGRPGLLLDRNADTSTAHVRLRDGTEHRLRYDDVAELVTS